VRACYHSNFVTEFILSILAVIRVFFRSRTETAMGVLALRQQVAVLKRKRPHPKLNSWDRIFWTALRRVWSRWRDVLVIVRPETVIGRHRAGFRLYWRWRPRPQGGRPKLTIEVRALIRRLVTENPDWGAPKMHGEPQACTFFLPYRPGSSTALPPKTCYRLPLPAAPVVHALSGRGSGYTQVYATRNRWAMSPTGPVSCAVPGSARAPPPGWLGGPRSE
jgi:hypothetical protein